MKYSVAPLLAQVDIKCLDKFGEIDDQKVADYLGVCQGTVAKWRKNPEAMIGVSMADKCSMEVGLHIEILWPSKVKQKVSR